MPTYRLQDQIGNVEHKPNGKVERHVPKLATQVEVTVLFDTWSFILWRRWWRRRRWWRWWWRRWWRGWWGWMMMMVFNEIMIGIVIVNQFWVNVHTVQTVEFRFVIVARWREYFSIFWWMIEIGWRMVVVMVVVVVVMIVVVVMVMVTVVMIMVVVMIVVVMIVVVIMIVWSTSIQPTRRLSTILPAWRRRRRWW